MWQEIPAYQDGGEREMLISISEACIMFGGFVKDELRGGQVKRSKLLPPALPHVSCTLSLCQTKLCITLQNFLSRSPASHRYLLLCCLEFSVVTCLAFSHSPLLDHLQESLEYSNKWITHFCCCGCWWCPSLEISAPHAHWFCLWLTEMWNV